MTQWATVAATGHRPQHLHPEARHWLTQELRRVAKKLRDQHGTQVAISGMALGVDTWWALAALQAGLQLWAHVPYPQQAERWRSEDQAQWRSLLDQATKITQYGDHYDIRLLGQRNRGMLSHCQAVVAGYDRRKTTGGTAHAYREARVLRLPIILLDPHQQRTTLVGGERERT